MDSDLESRRRTAQYFATLNPSEDYRTRWANYLGVIEGEIAVKEIEASELKQEAKSATGENLAALRRQINALKLSLGSRVLLPSELTSVGIVEQSIMMGDHHCANDCRGEPTRTSYVITLRAKAGHILRSPKVQCEGSGCGYSQVLFVTVGDDIREARASFDIWSRPTSWTLTAESFSLETDDS